VNAGSGKQRSIRLAFILVIFGNRNLITCMKIPVARDWYVVPKVGGFHRRGFGWQGKQVT
jgi:hypothetical protein